MGENPAMSDPDQPMPARPRPARAPRRPGHLPDGNRRHADVIPPASAKAEKTGTFSNTNRQVQTGADSAVPMPGDARQDWWIIQEIANRIGEDWNYTQVSRRVRRDAKVMKSLDNITWERLENARCGHLSRATIRPARQRHHLWRRVPYGNRSRQTGGRATNAAGRVAR